MDCDGIAIGILKDEGPAKRGVERVDQYWDAVGLELVMQRLGIIGAQ